MKAKAKTNSSYFLLLPLWINLIIILQGQKDFFGKIG